MSESHRLLSRTRMALLILVTATFVILPIELLLEAHWGSPPQVLPFLLCGLGAGIAVVLATTDRPVVVWTARLVFALEALGGLFGVWEHLEHNAAFAAEIAPNASTSEWMLDALTGANPLLAPGIFVLAAALGALASWLPRPG